MTMSKIKNSIHVEFIDDAILNDKLSLMELVIVLRKKGFQISKSSLATYARELKSVNSSDVLETYENDLQEVISNDLNVDYKKEHEEKEKIIYAMYDKAIKNAYKATMNNAKNGKVLPLNLYKSVNELQKLIKGHNEIKPKQILSND